MVPANIYERQAANRRNTFIVMLLFVLFAGFLGFGCDVILFGFLEPGHAVPVATILAVIIAAFGALWGLEGGAQAVLGSAGARPVDSGDTRYAPLNNIVDEMSIASGLPRPRVFVIPDPDPNAFATGKDPEHACIAVTQGLVEQLDRDELQAVVAHEMSHVRNFDIRLMTVVAALVGAVMLLSEFGSRSLWWGGASRKGSSRRDGGGGGALIFVLWLLGMILAPLLSQVLAMAVSRQREYLADASGAELTRNPAALASALEKIDSATDPTRSIKRGTAHLCIADPLGSGINHKEGFLADLFATHPPISRRIARLRQMSYQHG